MHQSEYLLKAEWFVHLYYRTPLLFLNTPLIVYQTLMLQHFEATESADLKLAVFCTGPAIRDYAANLVTEIIGTFTLIFGILSMTYFAGKDNPVWLGGSFGTWVVAVLVWAIGMSLGGPTGYAINPARDLGPRIAHALLPIPRKRDSDFAYGWVPVVGPIIGGIIGALVYAATFGSAPAPH